MRFCSIKDPHLSLGFQNRIRKNYEKDIKNKFDYVLGYCKNNNISNIIFTGDVFDSSKEDNWTFKKYKKNKRLLEMFKRNNIRLNSIVGNHDMFHGFETSDDTVFGEMVNDEILYNLTKDSLIEEEIDYKIAIYGIDYHNDENTVLEKIKIINDIKEDKSSFKAIVLHSNVTPDEVKYVTDFSYDKLTQEFPDIDMFIFGHYHVGYDTTTIKRAEGKDTIMINNYNFTRVVRDYETQLDEHSPEMEDVNIQYINGAFKVNTDTIQVPFNDYDSAFIAKSIEEVIDISSFFNEVNIDDIKKMGVQDDVILDNIIKDNGYDKNILSKVLSYLNSEE